MPRPSVDGPPPPRRNPTPPPQRDPTPPPPQRNPTPPERRDSPPQGGKSQPIVQQRSMPITPKSAGISKPPDARTEIAKDLYNKNISYTPEAKKEAIRLQNKYTDVTSTADQVQKSGSTKGLSAKDRSAVYMNLVDKELGLGNISRAEGYKAALDNQIAQLEKRLEPKYVKVPGSHPRPIFPSQAQRRQIENEIKRATLMQQKAITAINATNEARNRVVDVVPPSTPRGGEPPSSDDFGGYGGGGYASSTPSPVLIPGRDALNFATSGVIDALTSFIFEDLAGTEIITLMKRDTIDGIDPNYSIISNISDVRRSVDPTSLLSKKTKTDSYFDIFGIQLLDKIPDDEYLTKNNIVNYYYIASNGDLVIELDNIGVDERIDIEIATNGTIKELDN